MYLLTANPILIAAAVIPAIILLIKVYKEDKIEKEPVGFLITLVIAGVLSTALAVILETVGQYILDMFFVEDSLVYNILMYFIVVAFSEEGSKYLLLKKRTWKSKNFNYRFDGIVYAVFVALGFALWENIGYVTAYGLATALTRALTAVPGHACFGVFMGVWYGHAKQFEFAGLYDESRRMRRKAVLLPALMHGIYDFLTTFDSIFFGFIFVAFVIIMFIICYKEVKLMSKQDYDIMNNNDNMIL